MTDEMNLGRLLGQREAFQIVAARCSAADATLMRDIRDRKLYAGHAADWGEFCQKYLHTSRENANRIVRLLDEFGPEYFEVAQLTRISPTIYRAIAPAIQDHALQHDGEAIALIPENAEKVTAAVTELRKAVGKRPAKAQQPAAEPLQVLEQHCQKLLEELAAAIDERRHPLQLQAIVGSLQARLSRIELTI